MDFPDYSFEVGNIRQAFQELCYELSRAAIAMKPSITIKDSQWVCQYGDIKGVGNTPSEAMTNFDKSMHQFIKPHFYKCECGIELKITESTYMKNYKCPICRKVGQWSKQPF
jgi:hypothetical protein